MSTTTAPATESAQAQAQVVGPAERRRYIELFSIVGIATVLVALMWWKTGAGDFVFQVQRTAIDAEELKFGYDAKTVALICLLVTAVGLVLIGTRIVRTGPRLVVLALVVGLAFIVGFCAWAYSGQPAEQMLPMTNPLQGTIRYATPLVLGALAGSLCERAGVINIAIEGQFLAAAFLASVFSSLFYSASMGLIGGIIAGVAVGALLALFAIRYLVNQVVLGVVLVVFATGITGFLLDQIPDDKNEYLNTPLILPVYPVPGLASIPVVGDSLFSQNALVYIMYVSVPFVWFLLFKTTWGLRVRAVGEHPTAADTVGIKVKARRWQAVLVGGVFAGLGGAYFTVGSTGAFDKDASAGTGFIALAALIMGRWHPVGAAIAAVFFGFVSQLQIQLQILQKIPTELLSMTPYLATIIAVAGFVGRVRPPAADGEPYVKG